MVTIIQRIGLTIVLLTALAFALSPSSARAMPAAEIDVDVQEALAKLYANSDTAKDFGKIAKGILVFPDVYKAGFIVGAQFGEGALLKSGKTGQIRPELIVSMKIHKYNPHQSSIAQID